MPPFYVPAFHCVSGHHACSIYKHTIKHAQTAINSTTSAIPEHWCPLTPTAVKTDMQYLLSGNAFQFAHTDQNILQANITVEWLAVLVYSRNILGFSYDQEVEYLDRKRSYFSSVPQHKRRHSTLIQNTTASFHILSQFFLSTDLV